MLGVIHAAAEGPIREDTFSPRPQSPTRMNLILTGTSPGAYFLQQLPTYNLLRVGAVSRETQAPRWLGVAPPPLLAQFALVGGDWAPLIPVVPPRGPQEEQGPNPTPRKTQYKP